MSERPLRALIMAHSLGLGGIERDVSKFARYLPQHGVEPHVACFNPGGVRWREIESSGIPVFPLPVTSFKSGKILAENARTLRAYIAAHRIDVLHAFDIPTDVFGVPVARMAGVPVTISSQLCYRDLSPLHMRLLMAAIDRLATGVFVNCEAIADHLVRDWKVSRRRIHVVYNGVEADEFHAETRRRPPELENASVVIGAVAVLRPEKNLPSLLEAFAAVHAADPAARLVLVGSGPLKADLEALAGRLGIASASLFVEASAQPAAWMRAIDIFALPSRSEAFSNALLEAMACGCCPIGSRVGGTPELIADGERGVLFECGNTREFTEKLLVLARDGALRRRMGAAAAAFVKERLTMDVAAARLAAVYRGLLPA